MDSKQGACLQLALLGLDFPPHCVWQSYYPPRPGNHPAGPLTVVRVSSYHRQPYILHILVEDKHTITVSSTFRKYQPSRYMQLQQYHRESNR
ncbi:hypothetical protein BJX76DRAFT_326064 [Aspergillus varians]